MNKIPPVDLTRQYELISEEANLAVLEILNSGNYIGGKAVATFEQQFAQYTGVSSCVSCNSGTDALYLALRALNIGEGDEVITSPFTFFATAEVISRVGAKPIFVDIDIDTFNFNLAQVEKAISPQTKAIVPVHLFGQPVDMTGLMAIAKTHNLIVIEDCAQATGASWQEQKVGSIGHVGCFSFFPTKNLGACGDGGAVTTNDPAIAKQMRILKEHGSPERYRHDSIGINSRIDGIQAAILSIKLRHLDFWNEQRATAAKYYHELLNAITLIKLPQAISGGNSVWNQYTICVGDRKSSTSQKTSRDRVKECLQQQEIISMIYYPIPLHLQPVYRDLGYKKGQLPIVEQAAREVLSLPMFPGISQAEQERVAYALKDCLG
ncbi:DegT/DnrJ/EryC1/StrS aminotransferase family protein [Waterburya agarophytonicola K14]|uniref:DegT/DnrJ/EryC1/StrS aminotransferase family protein n=1 Tax=Waterburya agarophytonicola KI4 TaxID=2874699 RepID=A0A964FI08_9CYAN|nr:DegT/DnrJ/EryC1/StrS aminotransferase family protein [Waterburya agarophytonicola KI4]